jgi:hypothetical protein
MMAIKEAVMIELTEAQRQVAATGPCRLVDPQTQTVYVLVREDLYEKLESLLDDGLTMRQVGALVEAAMREEDKDDPSLESYQRYRRKP